jgi:mitochondrial fission protein ELM1
MSPVPLAPLNVLLLSDGKPGHYHQSEGVITAMARLRPVVTHQLRVRRRLLVPSRTLQHLLKAGVSPRHVLRLGYGLKPDALPRADVVVSTGGETLAANAAIAALLGCPNIFYGSLRRLPPALVRLNIVYLDSLAVLPNQLVSFPPSAAEPPADGAASAPAVDGTRPPRLIGALLGGDSGVFRYGEKDWLRLLQLMRDTTTACGARWIATTSRRSSAFLGDALASLAAEVHSPLAEFIDYRTAGPGSAARVLAAASAIVCTDDSTAMISEAVGARLPVVSLSIDPAAIIGYEAEYRAYLARQGWCRVLPLGATTPDLLLSAFEAITPRTATVAEELAGALAARLPELFSENR